MYAIRSYYEITFECWPRNVDILNPDNKPFAGWPVKFSQFDNYVVKNGFELPTLKIADVDCVVTVKNHYTKELIFSVRINGKEFKPKVENAGDYDILVGEGESINVITSYSIHYTKLYDASEFLLQDIVRKKWNFDGYIVSDCGAVNGIWEKHKADSTPQGGAALALNAGVNLNCGA